MFFLVIIGGPLRQEKGEVKDFDINGTLRSLGSIVFSLAFAQANFQAYTTTEENSRSSKSWMNITGVAVILGTLMCMCMGMVGYLSFRGSTEDEILDNFSGDSFDIFKVMVVLHLIFYIPTNFVIMRYSVVKVWYADGTKAENLSLSAHLTVSLLLILISSGAVLILFGCKLGSGGAFGFVLNITGGVAGSIPSFILPAAMYIKVGDKDRWLYNASWIVLVLGIILMFVVTIETIVDAV